MININKKDKCCGCTACENICPVKAIKMEKDDEGFLYPKIEKEKCIKCGVCAKVCPFLEEETNKIIGKVFSCHTKNNELLLKSSSGGVFGELAKSILKEKGIVIGVNNEYKYTVANNIEELNDLYGSKYIQAELGDIFKTIKTELNNKKLILFCGTPCTINGLKKYLMKDYENLYTCDFICHGVPSQRLLEKYKDFMHKKILKINFREKSNGWHNYSTVVHFKNQKYKSLAIDNEYMKAFFNDYCLRESCYNCKIKGSNRKADITLGDYWGIDTKNENYNFYGNSIIIINTKKGQEIFKSIKKNLIYKEIEIDELKKNPSYYSSSPRPQERNSFYKDLNNFKFKKIIKKYKLSPTLIRRIKIKIKNIMKG